MSIQAELMAAGAVGVSEHPGLQARGLGHHGLVPGRIEGELDARLAHRRDPLDLVAHVLDQDIAHATAGAVSVILTSTARVPSSFCVTSQPYTSPRSTMLMGISGS